MGTGTSLWKVGIGLSWRTLQTQSTASWRIPSTLFMVFEVLPDPRLARFKEIKKQMPSFSEKLWQTVPMKICTQNLGKGGLFYNLSLIHI